MTPAPAPVIIMTLIELYFSENFDKRYKLAGVHMARPRSSNKSI